MHSRAWLRFRRINRRRYRYHYASPRWATLVGRPDPGNRTIERISLATFCMQSPAELRAIYHRTYAIIDRTIRESPPPSPRYRCTTSSAAMPAWPLSNRSSFPFGNDIGRAATYFLSPFRVRVARQVSLFLFGFFSFGYTEHIRLEYIE